MTEIRCHGQRELGYLKDSLQRQQEVRPETRATQTNATLDCRPQNVATKIFQPVFAHVGPTHSSLPEVEGAVPAEVLSPPGARDQCVTSSRGGDTSSYCAQPKPTGAESGQRRAPAGCPCIPRAVGVTNGQHPSLGAQLQ